MSEEEQNKFAQWHFAGLQKGLGPVPGGQKVIDTIDAWLQHYGAK